MIPYLRAATPMLLALALTGCFQTELGGAVAGAKVRITDLRSGDPVENGLSSLTEAEFVEAKSQQAYDKLTDLGKMINLGNFFTDRTRYSNATYYLVTASGGADMDSDSDGSLEEPFTAVEGKWHAIMTGRQLKDGGYVVSPLTEAIYQVLRGELETLDDSQLRMRLNQLTQDILPDVNEDGSVNYTDALDWSVLVNRDSYLRDYSQVEDLAQAIRDGANQGTLLTMAESLFTDPVPDALEVYKQDISASIVQAICVRCHTSGGVAPNSGARLVVVTNSANDFQATNHQAFINLRNQLGPSQDLSDRVIGKATAQISHGGGRQLMPGSALASDLEAYLNLVEQLP